MIFLKLGPKNFGLIPPQDLNISKSKKNIMLEIETEVKKEKVFFPFHYLSLPSSLFTFADKPYVTQLII